MFETIATLLSLRPTSDTGPRTYEIQVDQWTGEELARIRARRAYRLDENVVLAGEDIDAANRRRLRQRLREHRQSRARQPTAQQRVEAARLARARRQPRIQAHGRFWDFERVICVTPPGSYTALAPNTGERRRVHISTSRVPSGSVPTQPRANGTRNMHAAEDLPEHQGAEFNDPLPDGIWRLRGTNTHVLAPIWMTGDQLAWVVDHSFRDGIPAEGNILIESSDETRQSLILRWAHDGVLADLLPDDDPNLPRLRGFPIIPPDTKPIPAEQAVIDALPTRQVEACEVGERCLICQDEKTVDDSVTIMPCDHWFCPECIVQWLKANGTCPSCRASVTIPAPSADNPESLAR